jgi:hypothetical protein
VSGSAAPLCGKAPPFRSKPQFHFSREAAPQGARRRLAPTPTIPMTASVGQHGVSRHPPASTACACLPTRARDSENRESRRPSKARRRYFLPLPPRAANGNCRLARGDHVVAPPARSAGRKHVPYGRNYAIGAGRCQAQAGEAGRFARSRKLGLATARRGQQDPQLTGSSPP